MGKVSMAVEQAKYQAEDDSRTLIRYAEIKRDAKRYKAAIEYLEDETTKLSKVVSESKGD